MAIETLPVWPFEPNWSGTYTEALEWLTDILTSPKGAEQRRSLRLYPRKTIEFTSAVGDNDNQVLRQFLEAHGSRNFYLPQWHESYRSTAAVVVGSDFIPCPNANNGGMRAGDVIFIGGIKARQYELAEVEVVSPNGVTLTGPLGKTWPAFSKIHPCRKARLDDQPTLRKVTDRAMTFTTSFRIMEVNDDVTTQTPGELLTSLDIYDGANVIALAPDEGGGVDFSFVRMVDNIDNQTGIPIFFDVATIPFHTQKHSWVINGRASYAQFKEMLFAFRGRATALWLPSFTDDMQISADTPVGDQYITVENFGFTLSGGLQTGHQHIAICFTDGTRAYRRIVGNTILGDDREIIGVDQPFPMGLKAADVLRISFIRLSRLDQDRLEIVHVTDTEGVSRCAATFKSAPNLRIEKPGF
jgi:hypothetical protein